MPRKQYYLLLQKLKTRHIFPSEMIDDFDNIEELLSDPFFLELKDYGLIDELALRNLMIKREYRILRNNLCVGDSVYQLSLKFFLSESAINSILFRKRNKKAINFPNPNHSLDLFPY